jgi:hypothetical protein
MRRPSHTTVVAYLALFVAVATGGAYAVERIGSSDVADDSLRSADLRDRKAVKGKDVKRDSLTGKEVREASLDAAGFAEVAGIGDALDCDPSSSTPVDCVTTTLELGKPARVLVVATGGQYTGSGGGDGSRAGCDIRIDGAPRPVFSTPGEEVKNTNAGATNGFARTLVTPQPLPDGPHEIALACWELDPDVRIETPTIAALAISAG